MICYRCKKPHNGATEYCKPCANLFLGRRTKKKVVAKKPANSNYELRRRLDRMQASIDQIRRLLDGQ
jgi:hypothetical protein